ncbi:MAG: hypothetical protein RIR00_1875 [Pseudomonadota bacterium]|jgi:FixJ family two-component response regulator
MAETVYVVDDDLSLREALSSLLRSVGLQVETFASALAFLGAPRAAGPACLVLDVRMAGMSGLDLQSRLQEGGDTLPVIFITGHGDIPMAVRAIKSGACEFLSKPFCDEDLIRAIRQALDKDRRTREEAGEWDELRRKFDALTGREKEVLTYIVQGALNKQSAAALGISEMTIKVHRHNIMRKMHARSLPDLVRMVERLKKGEG